MTSEHLALGDTDADARWIGIRRHQALLTVAGLAIIGDWVLRPRSSLIELVLGLLLVVSAAPVGDGLTSGQYVGIGLSFHLRSHWRTITLEPSGSNHVLHARRPVTIQGFELQHRGRLDLSGADVVNAARLTEMVNAMAVRGQPGHVSVHIINSEASSRTLLTLRATTNACEGWTPCAELVESVVGIRGPTNSLHILERWSYLRSNEGVLRVLRVNDFSAAPSDRAVLEHLQGRTRNLGIALHFDVVGGVKAQRISGRAVHRMGSDGAATRAIGFRRSARTARSLERVNEREQLVASGQALLKFAVFVIVRAATLSELRLSVLAAVRAGEESGLRIERGVGRQAHWYGFQLPGGPDW